MLNNVILKDLSHPPSLPPSLSLPPPPSLSLFPTLSPLFLPPSFLHHSVSYENSVSQMISSPSEDVHMEPPPPSPATIDPANRKHRPLTATASNVSTQSYVIVHSITGNKNVVHVHSLDISIILYCHSVHNSCTYGNFTSVLAIQSHKALGGGGGGGGGWGRG